MKVSSYTQRIGGFASANTGSIVDCYSDAKIKYKENAAGFVFENSGGITRSFAQRAMKGGKDTLAGFCLKNRGEVEKCGFLRAENEKKTALADEAFAISYQKPEDVLHMMALSTPWLVPQNGDERLELDGAILRLDAEGAIEITSAEQLMALAADIAAGDADAAGASYVLTKDINLGGKVWTPIGISDTVPFTGKFDGNGHKVYNFKIKAKDLPFAGFFGYVKGGAVANLTLDCMVNAAGGSVTGGMCAQNEKGAFYNCRVVAKVAAQKICGGFCGKNAGHIEKCVFVGTVSAVIPVLILLLPVWLGVLVLLLTGLVLLIVRSQKEPYTPTIIDPNQKPIVDTSPVDPPPAGSSRISIECNQDVYVNVATQVGIIDYVNPKRSSLDVMIRVIISDEELMRVIGRTGRSAAEQAALEANENYDSKTTYQTLYVSGRLKIGYMLEAIKLDALADGTLLPVGEYEMIVAIDAYDPVTFEKAVVNARAPITVHIVESSAG